MIIDFNVAQREIIYMYICLRMEKRSKINQASSAKHTHLGTINHYKSLQTLNFMVKSALMAAV